MGPQLECQIQPSTKIRPLTHIPLSKKATGKLKKHDLPSFDGENPNDWIFQAERYFHFYGLLKMR